jgi:thiamine-phosphate pyrophosphorylase
MRGYYFITDSALSRQGNYRDVQAAVAAGAEFIQYREKRKTTPEMLKEAVALRRLCKGASFIVNDRLDIALAVDADGLHLGQDDLPYSLARRLLGKDKIVGITVHNLRQAREAVRQGADYLAVSPIFATATKADAGRPVGVKLIRAIKKELRLPIVAIGGINLANAAEVIRAGADCLCAISAVAKSPDVESEIRKFQSLFYP